MLSRAADMKDAGGAPVSQAGRPASALPASPPSKTRLLTSAEAGRVRSLASRLAAVTNENATSSSHITSSLADTAASLRSAASCLRLFARPKSSIKQGKLLRGSASLDIFG
jgi:hypothetical protein